MIESEYFVPRDIECNGIIITKEEIRNRFHFANNLPILKKITLISRDITNKLKSISLENDIKWSSIYGNKIKRQLLDMLRFKTTRQLYQNFYEYFNCTHLYLDKKVMEYSDVFPYIYIKLHFEGISSNYNYVRHLLIDEMQDYTPVQYAIIKEIFKCKMTIMGDRNQNINPYSSSSSEKILSVFPNAACMDLTRSYRSTFEITEFSRRISPSINILPVERHGDDVTVHSCKLEQEEINIIRNALNTFKTSKFQSFAILCKSQLQAEILYNKLHELSEEIELLGFSDSKFKNGVILTSIQMAKGLEFDQVFIPQVQNENYHSEMERSLLYVACTRAMHKLEISYSGKPSLFI
jgi:DNA helicase-2/ATP-dependent DNA helicase PcrA